MRKQVGVKRRRTSQLPLAFWRLQVKLDNSAGESSCIEIMLEELRVKLLEDYKSLLNVSVQFIQKYVKNLELDPMRLDT